MKRQYIDFVPTKNRPIKQEIKEPVIRTVQVTYTENIVKKTIPEIPTVKEPVVVPTATVEDFLQEPTTLDENLFTKEPTPELGVIEDYAPAKETKKTPKITPRAPIFSTANVEKRPLSTPHHFIPKKTIEDAANAKAEKVAKKPLNLSKKPVEKPAKTKETEDFKPPFINRNVEKRPLSKTVYPKKQPAVVQEEASAPVTIINKPEKDAHVSLVIAILLTIVLGAAVGTVAFLLLPR